VGTNIVLRHASAFGVHDPEIKLGDGMALLSGPLKPDHRLTVVLRYVFAICVLVPEQKLGDGVALVCSLPKPSCCGSIILLHAVASDIH
jgi:hypothetical protein